MELTPHARHVLIRMALWCATGRQQPVEETDRLSFLSAEWTRLLVAGNLAPVFSGFAAAHSLEVPRCVLELSKVHTVVFSRQLDHLRTVLSRFAAHAQPVMVLKGMDWSHSLGRSGVIRPMGDVDLLVRRDELAAAERIMSGLGYEQGRLDRRTLCVIPVAPIERQRLLDATYETEEFHRLIDIPDLSPHLDIITDYLGPPYFWRVGGHCFVDMCYDIHYNTGMFDDPESTWQHRRPLHIPSLPDTIGQSWEAVIWTLCTRLTDEAANKGVKCFRYFVDLLCLLSRHGSTLDWRAVVDRAVERLIAASLYYPLRRATLVLPEAKPPSFVLDELAAECDRSGYGSRSPYEVGGGWHRGDMWPAILGFTALCDEEA